MEVKFDYTNWRERAARMVVEIKRQFCRNEKIKTLLRAG